MGDHVEAADKHGRIVRHAQQLQKMVKDGEKSLAEKSVQIERMAEDLRRMQQSLAEAQARDPLADAGGPDVELRRFIDNDGHVFLRGYEGNDPTLRRSDTSGLLTTKPVNEVHRNLIDACEALYVVAVARHGRDAFNHKGNEYRPDTIKQLRKPFERVQRAWSAMPKAVRKAWDNQNGTGGEFIPTPLLASPMWQVAEYDPEGILDIFPTIEIGTESVEVPVGTLYPVPYKGGGGTGDNPATLAASSVGTDKVTLSADPMYCMVFIHEDASADSIIATFPFIRDAIARSLTIGRRFAIVNGDTASDHQDAIGTWNLRKMFGAVDAGPLHYLRSCLGLRANAFDNSNVEDRSTHTRATIIADINAVGGPRGMARDVPFLTSYEGYLSNFVNLDGIVKANEYGDRAPIARGEVASIFGHPIIPTDAMPADLASTGLYTGSGATTGYCVFNRNMHVRVIRRGSTVLLQNDITRGGTFMRARVREGFKDMSKSGDASVRFARNMSL